MSPWHLEPPNFCRLSLPLSPLNPDSGSLPALRPWTDPGKPRGCLGAASGAAALGLESCVSGDDEVRVRKLGLALELGKLGGGGALHEVLAHEVVRGVPHHPVEQRPERDRDLRGAEK